VSVPLDDILKKNETNIPKKEEEKNSLNYQQRTNISKQWHKTSEWDLNQREKLYDFVLMCPTAREALGFNLLEIINARTEANWPSFIH